MSSKLYAKAADAVKKRNYDYAIELFLQELTRDPNNAEARRALRAAELKKFQEAGASPDSGAAVLKGFGAVVAAYVHKMGKNYEKAMLDCEQVLKHAPKHKGFLRMLGDCARLAGHDDAAKCAFEDLLEADRGSEHALRNLAQIYHDADELAQALNYYERLKKVNPSDGEAAKAVRDLAASGASRKVEERKAQGDGDFRDMIKDSGRARKLETKGKRVRTAEDALQAVQDLEEELSGGKEDFRILKQIGELHAKRKAWDDAVAAYEKALAVKKDNQVLDALGDLKLKRIDDELQGLLKKAKGGSAKAAERAKQLKNDRVTVAIDEYERRAAARPTDLGVKLQLGSNLFKAKRYDDAIGHLQKAAVDPRRGAQARTILAKCFAAKGLLDMAIKEFQKALDGTPDKESGSAKEIAYNLALVLEKAGKTDKAIEQFEKIVEVDIGYKDAMKRLEALQA